MKAKIRTKRTKSAERALSAARKVLETAGYRVRERHGTRSSSAYTFSGILNHTGRASASDRANASTDMNVELVMLDRPSFDQLIRGAEEAEDLAAIDRGQRGGSTYLPGEMALRIVGGKISGASGASIAGLRSTNLPHAPLNTASR